MEFGEFLRSSDKTAWILCRVLQNFIKNALTKVLLCGIL